MTTSVPCPFCGATMTPGWVAMWNPIMGQKVRWQPTKPGYGRLRIPKGAAVLLQARLGGKDAREAHRCSGCAATLIPTDPSYDG